MKTVVQNIRGSALRRARMLLCVLTTGLLVITLLPCPTQSATNAWANVAVSESSNQRADDGGSQSNLGAEHQSSDTASTENNLEEENLEPDSATNSNEDNNANDVVNPATTASSSNAEIDGLTAETDQSLGHYTAKALPQRATSAQQSSALPCVQTVDSTTKGLEMYMYKFPVSANFDDAANGLYDPDSRIFQEGAYTAGSETASAEQLSMIEHKLTNGYPVLNCSDGSKKSFREWFDTTGRSSTQARLGIRVTKANHLFSQQKYSDTGYLEYNCIDNYAYLDERSGNFTLYDAIGVPYWKSVLNSDGTTNKNSLYGYNGDNTGEPTAEISKRGQFFPYDKLGSTKVQGFTQSQCWDGGSFTNSQNGRVLYMADSYTVHFGMYLTGKFTQPSEGKITHTNTQGATSTNDMEYHFSGDDDLWVFIDGTLVLNIGGIHTARTGSINFATGIVSYPGINGRTTTTLKDIYTQAGVAGNYLWNGATFASDGVEHEFKMFYMERGEADGTLRVSTNLNTVPTYEVSKEVLDENAQNSIDGERVSKGDLLTYRINIENKSDFTQNFNVADAIPYGLKFVSAENGGACSDNTVAWNNVSIPSGKSTSVSFKVRVESVGKTYTNFATVEIPNNSSKQTNKVSNYSLGTAELTVFAEKFMDGGEAEEWGYEFKLTSPDDPKFSERDLTEQNGGWGDNSTIGFKLTYDESDLGKTYHYQMSEVSGNKSSIDYDSTTYECDVSITEENKQLVAKRLNSSSTAFTFNNYHNAGLALYKYAVDNSQKAGLPGAEFSLYEGSTWDEARQNLIATETTDEQGYINFNARLHIQSNYWVLETNAPEGYYAAQPYLLCVGANVGEVRIKAVEGSSADDYHEGAEISTTGANDEGNIVLAIEDKKVAAMPMTGAQAGMAGGVALACLGAAAAMAWKRKCERNKNLPKKGFKQYLEERNLDV